MAWFKRTFGILVLAVFLAMPHFATACPSCQDAIPASGTDDDTPNAPAAYNQSIYLMVGVPYLSFSILGFLIYRGCKRNALYLKSKGALHALSTEPA